MVDTNIRNFMSYLSKPGIKQRNIPLVYTRMDPLVYTQNKMNELSIK